MSFVEMKENRNEKIKNILKLIIGSITKILKDLFNNEIATIKINHTDSGTTDPVKDIDIIETMNRKKTVTWFIFNFS